MRVKRALQMLNRTDIAVLVVDGKIGMQKADRKLVSLFETKEIPYLIVYNQSDLCDALPAAGEK